MAKETKFSCEIQTCLYGLECERMIQYQPVQYSVVFVLIYYILDSRYYKNVTMLLHSILSSSVGSWPAKTTSENLNILSISNDGPLSKVNLDDIDLISAIQAEEIVNIIYSKGSTEGFLEENELNQSESTNSIIENDWTLDTTIHSSNLEKEIAVKDSENSFDECYNKEFVKNSRIVKVESSSTVHERKKPIQCVICDRMYATKFLLKYHIIEVHEGKQPFKCSACNRCFSRNFSLKKHILSIHKGKRLKQCSICDREFVTKSGLKQHINEVHEGKKPFQCITCNKCFPRKQYLKRHLLRPLICKKIQTHEKQKQHFSMEHKSSKDDIVKKQQSKIISSEDNGICVLKETSLVHDETLMVDPDRSFTISGPNAGPNAVSNAGPNAGPNAGLNARPNAGPNAGLNARPNAGPNAGLNAGHNVGSNAGPNAGPNAIEVYVQQDFMLSTKDNVQIQCKAGEQLTFIQTSKDLYLRLHDQLLRVFDDIGSSFNLLKFLEEKMCNNNPSTASKNRVEKEVDFNLLHDSDQQIFKNSESKMPSPINAVVPENKDIETGIILFINQVTVNK